MRCLPACVICCFFSVHSYATEGVNKLLVGNKSDLTTKKQVETATAKVLRSHAFFGEETRPMKCLFRLAFVHFPTTLPIGRAHVWQRLATAGVCGVPCDSFLGDVREERNQCRTGLHDNGGRDQEQASHPRFRAVEWE